MKKLIACAGALFSLLISNPAAAAIDDTCEMIKSFAALAVLGIKTGKTPDETLGTLDPLPETAQGSAREIFNLYWKAALELPRPDTEEGWDVLSSSFANDAYRDCKGTEKAQTRSKPSKTRDEALVRLCSSMGKRAETLLIERQEGRKLYEVLEKTAEIEFPSEAARKIYVSLISAAYEWPLNQNSQNPWVEAVKFGEEISQECLKGTFLK